MGLTRHDIETQLQHDEEEGHVADFSLKTPCAQDDEGRVQNYTGMDIHHTNWSFSKWHGLNLTRMQAPHSTFTGAHFSQVTLDSANFQRAFLDHVQMMNSSLIQTHAAECQLTWARFVSNQMQQANLGAVFARGAQFHQCQMHEVILSGAHLSATRFFACDLTRADFQLANLTDATFEQSNLTGANLSRSTLTNVVFTDTALDGVDLTYADMTGVCLSLEQLRKANLSRIHECFETICGMRAHGTLMKYHDDCLTQGESTSLSAYLGMHCVPNGPAHAIEQFTYGLVPKRNEAGEIDPRYSDKPVRTILLEWIEAWLCK